MSNEGMTQARWDGLNTAERNKLMDKSALHPRLVGLEGQRVRVSPKREHGRSTFWVGRTTGWKPCHLAMRAGAYGSSGVIRVDEVFYRVDVLGKARR